MKINLKIKITYSKIPGARTWQITHASQSVLYYKREWFITKLFQKGLGLWIRDKRLLR